MLGSTLRSEPRRRSRGRHRSKWTPHRLNGLRAWYDAELGQPKYMGVGAYVRLDGASTDNISTPDSATNSFSNDIEVITRVYCNDWTAASTQTVGGKYISSGNQRSWRFYVNSAGNVGLSASVDGTAVITVTVTPTVALVDATWFWLRLRLDLTDGANSVGYVDIADDTGSNYILPSSWTANGTATGSIISGLFDSTSPIEFGAFANGTLERFSGRVGRYIVRSGFDGTTVADFNASDCYGDGYWHEDGYRWTLGLPKIYDVSGNGVAPATFGAGTNQPQWLPWLGRSNVYLPGVASNFVSCPDSAALDITGDIDVLVQAPVQDLTLTTSRVFVAKGNSSASQYSWNFEQYHNNIYFIWTTGGTSATQQFVNINVTGTLTAERTYWLRATLVAATGVATLYWAPDSDIVPTSWTQIATKTVGSTSVFSGTAPVSIGALGGGSSPATGAYQRAIVRNGINGATVADFNAELCGQSGYTDTLGNVWTVNRGTAGRKTVVQSPAARSARSVWLYGTDDRVDLPAAAAPALGTSDAATLGAVGRNHANRQSFARHLSIAATATEAVQIGEITTGNNSYYYLSDGTNIAQGGGPALPQTVRNVRTLRIDGRGAGKLVDTINANAAVTSDTSAVGAVTATAIRLGASATSGGNADDGEIEAMFTLDRAISNTELGRLVAYYNGGV